MNMIHYITRTTKLTASKSNPTPAESEKSSNNRSRMSTQMTMTTIEETDAASITTTDSSDIRLVIQRHESLDLDEASLVEKGGLDGDRDVESDRPGAHSCAHTAY